MYGITAKRGVKVKEVDLNKTVYQLIVEYPDLKQILVGLGFTPLQDDKMLHTVGRMMPLSRGARQVGISTEELTHALGAHGFKVKG